MRAHGVINMACMAWRMAVRQAHVHRHFAWRTARL